MYEDPIGYAGGSTNIYLLARNNVKNRQDPSGLAEVAEETAFSKIVPIAALTAVTRGICRQLSILSLTVAGQTEVARNYCSATGNRPPKPSPPGPIPPPPALPRPTHSLDGMPIPPNVWDPNGPKAPGYPGDPGGISGWQDPEGGPTWVPGKNGQSGGWKGADGKIYVPTGGKGSDAGEQWDIPNGNYYPGGYVRPR